MAWVFLLNSRPAYFSLGLVAALFLKSSPGFELSSLALVILPLVFMTLKWANPFHPAPGAFILAFLGTGIFYAVADYGFILSHPWPLVAEGALNGICGALALWILKRSNHG